MRKLAIAVIISASAFVGGCSSLLDISFYDDNEAEAAIDLQVDVQYLDCTDPDISQVRSSLDWLMTYTNMKGSSDIAKMLKLMDTTVTGMEEKETISMTYCNLKKSVMEKQSSDITRAVMGRF